MITIDISSEIPGLSTPELIAGLSAGIRKGVLVLEGASKMNTPVNTGFLRNSFRSRFTDLEGELVNTSKYAPFVHEGRRPGKMPPIDQIEAWTKRKGINVPAFLIARSIARKGTKANPFFTLAVESEEENVISIIKSEIQNRIG